MKSSSGYEIYHNTLSSCLNEVESLVESKGYQVGDYFPLVNHVAYGQTERTQLEMIKNGKVANTLAIQIYRMESGRYELNCYPVRKYSGGGSVKSYYIVTFGFNGDDDEYEVHDSKPILAENEEEAMILLQDSFWNSEGIKPDIITAKKLYNGGGSTDQEIDLFEHYDKIPPAVKTILDNYSEDFEDGNYQGLQNAKDELEQIGYTFDFYLDGEAYDLRRIGSNDTYATGGGIKSLKVGDKFIYKFDNKVYEVVSIEENRINLHNTQGKWWDNRSVTLSLMEKWLKNKSMVKTMANGGGIETYKDLSKETPLVINDSSAKIGKVPEIDLIKTGKVIDAPAIRNSPDCYAIFKEFWNENNIDIVEQLNVLFLSKANKPLGIYQHSKGGIDGTTLDIEIISAMAVKSLAKGVVIAHNHPSGALVPSEADKQMTQKLSNALNLFQIGLVDSLIITNNGYFSFADQGIMP